MPASVWAGRALPASGRIFVALRQAAAQFRRQCPSSSRRPAAGWPCSAENGAKGLILRVFADTVVGMSSHGWAPLGASGRRRQQAGQRPAGAGARPDVSRGLLALMGFESLLALDGRRWDDVGNPGAGLGGPGGRSLPVPGGRTVTGPATREPDAGARKRPETGPSAVPLSGLQAHDRPPAFSSSNTVPRSPGASGHRARSRRGRGSRPPGAAISQRGMAMSRSSSPEGADRVPIRAAAAKREPADGRGLPRRQPAGRREAVSADRRADRRDDGHDIGRRLGDQPLRDCPAKAQPLGPAQGPSATRSASPSSANVAASRRGVAERCGMAAQPVVLKPPRKRVARAWPSFANRPHLLRSRVYIPSCSGAGTRSSPDAVSQA